MTKDQLHKANKLSESIREIEQELELWEKELTSKKRLAYLQGWNNDHAVKLNTHISDGIFDGFKMSVMDNLKLKLVYLNKQLDEL